MRRFIFIFIISFTFLGMARNPVCFEEVRTYCNKGFLIECVGSKCFKSPFEENNNFCKDKKDYYQVSYSGPRCI